MKLVSLLLKPFANKLKKDASDLVLAFLESRKKADEDGDGQADFEQLKKDAGDITEGIKLIVGGGTRIAALFMCYYLKYSPQQKLETLQEVTNAASKVKIALLADNGEVELA